MKRLVTFLGTGTYATTCYALDDAQHESKYVADAIAVLAEVDQVWILATEQVEGKHGSPLLRQLPDTVESRILPIPGGKNTAEPWQQFEAI